MKRNQLQQKLFEIIASPFVYIALVTGAVAGAVAGGIIGTFVGGILAKQQPIFTPVILFAGIDGNITAGAIMGLTIGSTFGTITIALLTASKIVYRAHIANTDLTMAQSATTQQAQQKLVLNTLNCAIKIAIELTLAMGLGAVVVSIKWPGAGTCLGALAGLGLVLFPFNFDD